jgi:phospholipid/cholesterol/gamma-HCH transport system substrate-binding protein
MKRAIREHLRDFVAITLLLFAGLAVTVIILSQQQQPYPSWIPFLGDDQFELKVEFDTAQAVTPGQGQTVNMAGVEVGDITEVGLEEGKAVVTLGINEPYQELIRSDATMLLRPRTGLQDMTVEIDPGRSGPAVEEGATVPLSQTEPNVMPDQILASLDADTRDYLQLLLQGGAEGFGGRAREFSAGLRRFEPFGRDLARINVALAARRENIKRAISSLRSLTEALGRTDTQLADFVTTQNEVFGAFADQEASLRELLQELPSTLRVTRGALESGDELALELDVASRALLPTARTFAPAQVEAQRFARETVGPIENQIRPFTRQVRTPIRHLKQAAGPLGQTVKGTTKTFGELERFFNAWAYNPAGEEEGYLFWTGWLNHNANNTGFLQDAQGPLPRGIVLQSCVTATEAERVALSRPYIRLLLDLTHAPSAEDICAIDPAPALGIPGLP